MVEDKEFYDLAREVSNISQTNMQVVAMLAEVKKEQFENYQWRQSHQEEVAGVRQQIYDKISTSNGDMKAHKSRVNTIISFSSILVMLTIGGVGSGVIYVNSTLHDLDKRIDRVRNDAGMLKQKVFDLPAEKEEK